MITKKEQARLSVKIKNAINKHMEKSKQKPIKDTEFGYPTSFKQVCRKEGRSGRADR